MRPRLVDGMPVSRGSMATAARSARASALNWHSAMWCGSRPAVSVMCIVRPAWWAIDSNTCEVSEPE